MTVQGTGDRTGDRCACGAHVVAYREARGNTGGRVLPLDELIWYWFLVCEAGHIQPAAPAAPAAQPEQLGFEF